MNAATELKLDHFKCYPEFIIPVKTPRERSWWEKNIHLAQTKGLGFEKIINEIIREQRTKTPLCLIQHSRFRIHHPQGTMKIKIKQRFADNGEELEVNTWVILLQAFLRKFHPDRFITFSYGEWQGTVRKGTCVYAGGGSVFITGEYVKRMHTLDWQKTTAGTSGREQL